ncbi:MAG: galactokinase [Treponema sp.]|jgi:galactokinase|nr:galactokinase [Treponema sp.]
MLDIGPIHRSEYDLVDDRSEPVFVAEAPGRLHYLGEHGEPQAGLFLSSAVDRLVQVAVSFRKDNSLRFFAADLGERKRTTLMNLKYKREDRWANYMKLPIHIFGEMGVPLRGLNFTVTGDIPVQAGLASSTAIEAAAAIALRALLKVSLSDRELLIKLHEGEAEFFTRTVSPVEFLVIFNAKKDHFLLVDELTLEVERIKSPLSKYKLLLMDSRVPRMRVEDELKQRQLKTKKGLEFLSRKKQGAHFRDFAPQDLLESMGDLSEEVRRRSLHVVEELQRIGEAERVLKKNDLRELSRIIYHSHESLRDLYEVSCPEIDWVVKRAQETEGILGSRMTGVGFGGCTYTFIREPALEEYRRRLEDYERIFGFHPLVYEMRPAAGARLAVKG